VIGTRTGGRRPTPHCAELQRRYGIVATDSERLYGSEEATLWKLRQVDGEAIVLRIAAERHSLEVVSFIRWRLRDEIWSATLAKHR
jgi:hypothetical protein